MHSSSVAYIDWDSVEATLGGKGRVFVRLIKVDLCREAFIYI